MATQAEIARGEDMGDFLRIRMDGRDLNYGKYFVEGKTTITANEDYNSSNTEILGIPQIKELLLSLPEIQNDLK